MGCGQKQISLIRYRVDIWRKLFESNIERNYASVNDPAFKTLTDKVDRLLLEA